MGIRYIGIGYRVVRDSLRKNLSCIAWLHGCMAAGNHAIMQSYFLYFQRILRITFGFVCLKSNIIKIRLYPYTFIALYLLLFSFAGETYAQSTRSLVNNGVEFYNEKKFSDAEVNFKKGAENNPESFEAKFNLGDAYYKQQRYDEAMKSYQSAFVDAKSDLEKSKIYYNIGNSLLKSQKLKESIGAYKEALKLNPDDQETKYNLSYALNMMKNKNQDKQQNQDKDQNKDQQDKDKDKQDQNQQNQNQQQKDQQKQEQQQQSQEQKEQELTKKEAEKILNALKENEKDLQKQLRKIKGQRIKTEKDW